MANAWELYKKRINQQQSSGNAWERYKASTSYANFRRRQDEIAREKEREENSRSGLAPRGAVMGAMSGVDAARNAIQRSYTEPMTGSERRDRGQILSGNAFDIDTLTMRRNVLENQLKETNSGSYQSDKLKRWSNAERRQGIKKELEEIEAELERLGMYDADAAYYGRQIVGGAAGTTEGFVNALGYAGELLRRQQQAEQGQSIAGIGALIGNKDMQMQGLDMAIESADPGKNQLQPIARFGTNYNTATQEKYTAVSDRDKLIGDVMSGVSGMVPAIVSNLAAPGSGLYVMMTSAAGNAATEAKAAGVDDSKAMLYGISVGAVEGLTEMMFAGTGKLLNKTGLADNLLTNAVKKLLANNPTAQMAVKGLTDTLGEGFEEFVAELAGKGLNDLLVGSDKRSWGQAISEAGYNGIVGILVGAILQTSSLISPTTTPKEAADIVASEMMKQTTAPLAEPQNFASDGVSAPDITMPVREEKSGEAVSGTAEKQNDYGKNGAAAFAKIVSDYALDEETARGYFDTAYKLGLTGIPRAKATLENPIHEAAYEAGRKDEIASNYAIESDAKSSYTETKNTEGLKNAAEEIHLRDSGEWSGSAYTGGQVPGMEEGTGRNKSRKAQSRPADSEAASLTYGKRVSTASLGIGGGSTQNNIQLVQRGETKATRAAKQIASERGLRLVLFAGNNLEIRQSDGTVASVRAYISGDRVFVRADHDRYTADQLMRHEAGHDMIAKGQINPNTVRERIARSIGKEKSGQLADMYVEAYEGTGLSADEVWEEVICDSLGDMNIFSTTDNETYAWELLTETRAASADSQTESGRGPPARAKYSRDLEERRRALRAGEMVNEFRDKVNWPAYYNKLKSAEFNSDYFDDGDRTTMNLGGQLLILEMQRNGEFSVIDVLEAKYETDADSGKRNVGVHAGKEMAHERTGNDDRSNRVGEGRESRGREGVGDFAHRTDSEGSGKGRAADASVKTKFSQELEAVEQMREENAQFKNADSAIQTLFRSGTLAKMDKKTLSGFARDIIRDTNSGASIDDVTAKLRDLHDYIVAGEDGGHGEWNTAFKQAQDIAAELLESSSEIDDSMYQQYKELRDTIRTTGISISKEYNGDLAGYESIDDFRKANFGRIKLVNDGLPVDSFYRELSESYPEFFDESEHSNPADQLNHIAEVLDSLRPYEINPFSHNMNEASAWLAEDIMMRFYRVQNEKLAAAVQRGKENALRTRRREIAKRDAKLKELRQKQRAKEKHMSESRQARILRDRITRHATDLSRILLRPSDKKHIPQKLQGAVAKLLESINMESLYTVDAETGKRQKGGDGLPAKRTQAFLELKKLYAEMAGELVYDPDMDDILSDAAKYADKPIAAMNYQELDAVWKALSAVENTVQKANKLFAEGRWQTVAAAADAIRKDNEGKKEKTELKKPLSRVQKLIGLDMMTPEAYFHRLGSSGNAIFRMLRDAQDEHIRIMSEISEFTHKELNGVDVRKLENEMHTVTLGGEKVQLSTAQIMELYVLTRRTQALDHISVGGILPDTAQGKGLKMTSRAKPVRGITAEELSATANLLTEEQTEIAKKLQEYASTVLSDYGNKASMQVYNYEKFGEKNYWPIRVNKQETQSDINKDSAVVAIGGKGFTKATTPHANNSVRIGSIFDTFATHASEMATYSAWLATSEDVNRIRNYTFRDDDGNRVDTVKGIIETVHGKQGTAYLQKLLEDIANGVKGTHGETSYMGGIVGNYKAASVGANIRVMIQQPTAILRALDMIDAKYLTVGLKPNKGWKKALQYAPIAKWKDWGYFDINTGRQMKDVLFDSDTVLGKTNQFLMAGAGKMDSLAWGQLWNAVEAETKDKHKDLRPGTKEYYDFVAKRFAEIIDHTQVVDGILQRSQIMRSADGLTKMATSFMGEPTKQYNMFVSAAYDAISTKGEGSKKAKQRLARTGIALVISGITNAVAQSIVDGLRDDDREKDYWEKWLASFTGITGEEEDFGEKFLAFWSGNLGAMLNPLGYIPYAKDIVSLVQGYDVSRMDMDSIADTITAGQHMIKALRGEGKFTLNGAFIELVSTMSKLIGLPIANIKREALAVANLVANESDNYLMQYRIEKVFKRISYSGNVGAYLDILYNAYVNDQEAYKLIYADMVKSGFAEDKIKSGIESRMKKAQGVTSVSDLEQRYMTPQQQTSYDSALSAMENSKLWGKSSNDAKEDVADIIYDLATQNASGLDMQAEIDDAAKYGIDETQYLLFQLALRMADKPNENGNYGTYTGEEVEDAIGMMSGLDREAKSWFWLNEGKSEKANPWG